MYFDLFYQSEIPLKLGTIPFNSVEGPISRNKMSQNKIICHIHEKFPVFDVLDMLMHI